MNQDTDTEVLSDALDDLRKENKRLLEEKRIAENKAYSLTQRVFFESVLGGLVFFGTIIVAMGVSAFLLYKILTVPEIPDFCTITQLKQDRDCYCPKSPESESLDTVWQVRGSIPWHPDRTYGIFRTFDEAEETASKLRCKVR